MGFILFLGLHSVGYQQRKGSASYSLLISRAFIPPCNLPVRVRLVGHSRTRHL